MILYWPQNIWLVYSCTFRILSQFLKMYEQKSNFTTYPYFILRHSFCKKIFTFHVYSYGIYKSLSLLSYSFLTSYIIMLHNFLGFFYLILIY